MFLRDSDQIVILMSAVGQWKVLDSRKEELPPDAS